MSAPTRLIVTGDFLRPSAGGLRPTQHENIRWLAQCLAAPLQLACDLPRETLLWDNRWVERARIDAGTVRAVYAAFGLPATIRSWPRIFSARTLPDAIESLFHRLFRDALVIGFELPPYLAHFFTRHGIAFIDLSISPIRFMDDLLLDVSVSDAAMRAVAETYRVPDALISLQAGAVSAHVAKMFPAPPRPNTLLVILQTLFDKVVIEDGRFVTVLDHLDSLREIVREYEAVLIREHPLEKQDGVGETLLRALPNAALTEENFYRLAGHHNLRGVAALSSSCVAEARWFGKTAHYLIPGFSPDRFTPGEPAVTVDDVMSSADFWRDILGAADLRVTDRDGLRLPPKPNRLRQQLRSAWGYNQIDTDIFAQWAAD
ncbi:MAG: hypothetical protein AAF408_03820 [Pseudomonadota bacterium]